MRETKQVSINKESLHRHVPMIGLGVFVILAAAMILVSYFALGIPLVPVCTLVILEAVLCACLNRIPIWTHVVIVAVQVAIGFFLDRGSLMICMAVVYVAAVVLLYLWTREEA